MTKHQRPLRKGFAHKKPLALAIDKAILMTMIDASPVYDPIEDLVKVNLPAGGYVALSQRLRYEQDMRRLEFAMTAAPVHDSASMISRMEWISCMDWIQHEHFNLLQPSLPVA